MSVALDEIRRMSVAERLQLLEEIWETLREEQETLPLSEAQAREIDRRLETYRRHGDRGITWDELDRRLETG